MSSMDTIVIAAGICVVAAIAVISVILAVAVQPELKADEVDVSEVRGGVLSVSVGATGSVVPFYEETVTSPIVSKILEVYKKLIVFSHNGLLNLRM